MSLVAVLRKGVGTINKVTKKGGLQATVTFRRSGANGLYEPSLGSGVPLGAILEAKSTQSRTPEGIVTVTRTQMTLLDVQEIVDATSGLGFIKDTDTFTLPDGSTSAIVDTGGFIDAGTGHPIATEITLG